MAMPLDEPPTLFSKRGDFFVEEPDYGLPLHPKLFYVIDQLTECNMPLVDIADVCDAEPEVISQYLQLKREYQEKLEERQRDAGEVQCVEARWHETLSLIVKRPSEAHLMIELVEGDDKVVGHLDPISLKQLMLDGGILPKAMYRLTPVERQAAKTSFLSSLLFPTCNKPVLVNRSRYRAVRMELSVKLQPLVLGTTPRTVSPTVPQDPKLAPASVVPTSVSNGGALPGSQKIAARMGGPRVGITEPLPARVPLGMQPSGAGPGAIISGFGLNAAGVGPRAGAGGSRPQQQQQSYGDASPEVATEADGARTSAPSVPKAFAEACTGTSIRLPRSDAMSGDVGDMCVDMSCARTSGTTEIPKSFATPEVSDTIVGTTVRYEVV